MRITITLLFVWLTVQSFAQSHPDVFSVGISFNSICCGPPSSTFLPPFLSKYKKEKKNIKIWISEGCGKEGEYYLLFDLGKMSIRKRTEFILQLTKLTNRVNSENRQKNNSTGVLEVQNNIATGSIKHCRAGIKPWEQ